jgi:hypothetical protein
MIAKDTDNKVLPNSQSKLLNFLEACGFQKLAFSLKTLKQSNDREWW